MMRSVIQILIPAFAILSARHGLIAQDAPVNQLSEEQRAQGWQLLFDGTDLSQWRNYRKDDVGPGWKVDDGILTRADKGAGDIISKETFAAFELILDYRIEKGGNSGLMYHVTEEGAKPWNSGPEVQIQDNVDGHDKQKAGWLYQLYPAEIDATRPAGEWNTLRLLITPEKCVHWMNGRKYCEYVKGSADWDEKVAASKFSRFAFFGKAQQGHLCLQDHGNVVSFRNIRIRRIPIQKTP
ncbi:MAG: DUF1080 domain-containing protein [Planctomycetaceae bacterium]|nr:DUF1080 domain-containing protein [Planctomycetaceae bacterium]